MDCFDTHYYRLHCKLLALIGQWPYQNISTKITRRVLFMSFLAISAIPQIASLVVEKLDFNMILEIMCCQVGALLLICRSLLFAFNQDEMLELLEIMKFNWLSLADKDEHDIFNKTALEAKRGMMQYLIIVTLGFSFNLVFLVGQYSLQRKDLTNGTSTHNLLYQATYFIDEEKYFYLITAHMILVLFTLFIGLSAADAFFVIFMYHAVGMFRIVCHQLEHVFDPYHNGCNGPLDGRTVIQRFACAVEWHKRAIRFRDGIVTTTQWPNLISVILSIIDISLALYWVFMSKGSGCGPILGAGLLFHCFCLSAPAQMVADTSVDITYRAYSSLWYMAPIKEQSLLLFTMQRGLKPCHVQIGKVHPLTLEYYAMVIKTAFSYFTALLSLK